MMEFDGIKVYTDEDTDLGSIGFVPFVPEAARRLSADFPAIVWYADGHGDEEALVAIVTLLGERVAMAVSWNSYAEEWSVNACQRNWAAPAGSAATRESATERAMAWLEDRLDPAKVIAGMPATSRAFAKGASDAGLKLRIATNGMVSFAVLPEDAPEEAEMFGSIEVHAHRGGEAGWNGYWHAGDPAVARQHGFPIDPRKGFDLASIIDRARSCDRCGRPVPFPSLRFVGFANAACPDCEAPLRKAIEVPGWCS